MTHSRVSAQAEAKIRMRMAKGDIVNGLYRVVDIMRGGMGIVYVCDILSQTADSDESSEAVRAAAVSLEKSTSTDQAARIVLKTFDESEVWGPIREQFTREAQIWISLPYHPNVVKAKTLQREGRQYLISMQYVDGGNLRELLADGPLSCRRTVKLACEVCQGMEFLQEYGGIVHRDLKPENILLTKSGIAKVTDLGLAVICETHQKLMSTRDDMSLNETTSSAKGFAGTLPYMAPEQFTGGPVSKRTDVFSFGVLLYEMLSGTRPFGGLLVSALRNEILNKKPQPLPTCADVPPRLADIITKCLDKNPEKRYESFRDLRADIVAFAEAEGLEDVVPESVSIDEVIASTDAVDWNNRAYALARLDMLEESLDAYKHSLELDSSTPEQYSNVGTALNRLKRYDEALPYLQEGVRLVQRHKGSMPKELVGGAYAALSNCYELLDKKDEAIREAKQGVVEAPDSLFASRQLVRISLIFDMEEEYQAGIEKLTKILKSNPKGITSEGVNFAQWGAQKAAAYLFQLAVEECPESGVAWYNLGVYRHMTGRLEEASQAYSLAIKNGRDTVLTRVNRGILFANVGYPSAAFEDWKKALEIDPSHPAVQLAEHCIDLGEACVGWLLGQRSTLVYDG